MSCVFCRIAQGAGQAHIVYEDPKVMAFLDHRPLFHGHTLVIPKQHAETLWELPAELISPLFETVRILSLAVPQATCSQGSFVAINNKVSQSVPHLHVHVVPRNRKDGLRGFFWPRHPYQDHTQMEQVATAIRQKLSELSNDSRYRPETS